MKNVKKALQHHIKDSIKPKYLESLVENNTQLIQEDISNVLEFLFDLYGKVLTKEVKHKETKIYQMTLYPADPMVLLFNPIKKLYKMAESAETPYTIDQVLNIGLTII